MGQFKSIVLFFRFGSFGMHSIGFHFKNCVGKLANYWYLIYAQLPIHLIPQKWLKIME